MKKEKKKFKKPNYLLYGILILLCKIIAKVKFNLKIGKNEIKKLKGPYIVLANHESSIDFINLICCTNRRLSIVVSNSFYQSLNINPLMKMCGVIPKQQFQTTVSDMRKMKEAINANRHLAIYPTGLMTENGLTTPIPEATGKFVQWLGADVYIAKTRGTYLTNPKWGKVMRKGKVTLDVTKLLSKEELKNYSTEELQKMICEQLDYNAYKNQEVDMVEYKNGNDVRGLENVLYWCPKCHKEFVIKNENTSSLKCECCGNEVYADNYGFLNPKTEQDICYKHPSDWYNALYNELKEEVVKDDNYCLESKTIIKMLNYKKHSFEEVGSGVVKLSREGFVINGVIKGEEKEIKVAIKTLPILPFKPGVHFEIQDGDIIYRCCLENGKEVSKWINVLKIFYELNN